MMGAVFFLLIMPILLAMIAFLITMLVLVGMLLLVVSFTGMGMNAIHKKQTGKPAFGRFTTLSSLFSGLTMILVPVGYGLYLLFRIFTPG